MAKYNNFMGNCANSTKIKEVDTTIVPTKINKSYQPQPFQYTPNQTLESIKDIGGSSIYCDNFGRYTVGGDSVEFGSNGLIKSIGGSDVIYGSDGRLESVGGSSVHYK